MTCTIMTTFLGVDNIFLTDTLYFSIAEISCRNLSYFVQELDHVREWCHKGQNHSFSPFVEHLPHLIKRGKVCAILPLPVSVRTFSIMNVSH